VGDFISIGIAEAAISVGRGARRIEKSIFLFKAPFTGEMAPAARRQLKILSQEQADRQIQLAKKPKLVLYIGNNTAPMTSHARFYNKPVQETATTMTFDFTLVNEGDAIATRPLMRVVTLKTVSVTSDAPGIEAPVEPVLVNDAHLHHLYPWKLDNIRPKTRNQLRINFHFPADTKSFHVEFYIDSDEIEAGSFLGGVDFNVTHPQDSVN